MATASGRTGATKYLTLFADAVRNRRTDDFEKALKELLEPDQLTWLDIEKTPAEHILSPKLNQNILLAAFHYTNPSLGRWVRLLREPSNLADVLSLKPLELAQHSEAYNKAPRYINIPVWECLAKHFWIDLGAGDRPTDVPEADVIVSLSETQRTTLNNLFDDFEISNFYDLILGLDDLDDTGKCEKHPKTCASIKDLKHDLEKLCTLRFPAASVRERDRCNELTWRAFVFSFFLAIRLKKPAWVLVLPLWEKGLDSFPRSEAASWLPATYVAALKQPGAAFIETAKTVLRPIVRMLTQVELRAMEASGSPHVVVFENTVRLCTMIDERVQQDVNEYRRRLEKKLEETGVIQAGALTAEDDLLKDTLKMTGADPGMLAILDRLYQAATSGADDKGLKSGVMFFLHSEPGCGKERLAHLCHLFSPRAGARQSEVVRKEVVQAVQDLGKRPDLERLIGRERAAILHPPTPWYSRWLPALNGTSILTLYPSFGYASFNAGLLNNTNFEEAMFGSEETAGQLYRAHLLRGTLFLDECNTLEPRLANQLLRAFEEPYQIVIKKKTASKDLVSAEQKINVQVVFGSNKSPDQLLSDGFNSAVVFRIAKQPFRVPPLRERKVDIAIFVNKQFLDWNEKKSNIEKLRRISLEGLRVICELPWPDNYRGVKGLLDDILVARAMRGVKDPEISFDEVIQAVARREVMGGGARSERTGQSFSGTIR